MLFQSKSDQGADLYDLVHKRLRGILPVIIVKQAFHGDIRGKCCSRLA